MRIERLLNHLRLARHRVGKEIADNASHGRIAAGLAMEGYAGGYRQALDDVDAVARDTFPTDPRHYWQIDAIAPRPPDCGSR